MSANLLSAMTTATEDSNIQSAREQALALRVRTFNAFTVMDCRKALIVCNGDSARAAEWLANGGWRTSKLISWGVDSLNEKIEKLVAVTGLSDSKCRMVLMNCAGNVELAKRKLQGLPALPD